MTGTKHKLVRLCNALAETRCDFPLLYTGAKANSPVSILRFLHEPDQVTSLHRDVLHFTRLVGQLHPKATAVTLQKEITESHSEFSWFHFGCGSRSVRCVHLLKPNAKKSSSALAARHY